MDKASSLPDHYACLGVPRHADQDAVKRAYRRLAMQFHPDRNPGDKTAEEHFKRINEAYAVLRSETARAAYDIGLRAEAGRSGRPGPEQGGSGRKEARGRGESGGAGDPPSSFRWPQDPVDFPVSLDEAWRGGNVRGHVEWTETCPVCGGYAARQQTEFVPCPACSGRGLSAGSRLCRRCMGVGWVSAVCQGCGRKGYVRRTGDIGVAIPAGVEDGDRAALRIPGSRNPVPVVFRLKGSRRLQRRGDDVMMVRRLAAARAAKGTSLTVEVFDGRKVRIRVPPGTAPGTQLRLRGLGMPTRSGGRGDLLVRVEYSDPFRRRGPGKGSPRRKG